MHSHAAFFLYPFSSTAEVVHADDDDDAACEASVDFNTNPNSRDGESSRDLLINLLAALKHRQYHQSSFPSSEYREDGPHSLGSRDCRCPWLRDTVLGGHALMTGDNLVLAKCALNAKKILKSDDGRSFCRQELPQRRLADNKSKCKYANNGISSTDADASNQTIDTASHQKPRRNQGNQVRSFVEQR
eukprot:scaffold61_cov205-Alexandrium_tamarense.AAC.35